MKGCEDWYAGTRISLSLLGCSDALEARDTAAREASYESGAWFEHEGAREDRGEVLFRPGFRSIDGIGEGRLMPCIAFLPAFMLFEDSPREREYKPRVSLRTTRKLSWPRGSIIGGIVAATGSGSLSSPIANSWIPRTRTWKANDTLNYRRV